MLSENSSENVVDKRPRGNEVLKEYLRILNDETLTQEERSKLTNDLVDNTGSKWENLKYGLWAMWRQGYPTTQLQKDAGYDDIPGWFEALIRNKLGK